MAGVTKRNLDFTNVKDGGGRWNKRRFPEGDYRAKITAVEDGESKAGNPMWIFTIEVKYKGQVGTYALYCVLDEKNLWKLRSLFAAAGIVLAKKRLSIDPNRIVGKEIGVTLEDTEYQDKLQSQVAATLPLSEIASAEEDATDDDEEDEDEEEDEETTDETEDSDEDEEEEDEDEEEEEPEPTPPPKKKAAKKAAAPAAKAKVGKPATKRTVKDEDLEELDLEDV